MFGLLCWDIIFASVDGAFETPYQSAPLDIAEDTFFYSREKIARERLKELADAKKDDVAKMVDEAYTTHEKKMCIGVRWDLFTKDDLVGIAKVFEHCRTSATCTDIMHRVSVARV